MAEDLFKVIFQLGADAQQQIDELNKLKGKYIEINVEVERQRAELRALQQEEAKLIKGRNAANNVTQVAQYNKALDDNKKKIIGLKTELDKLTGSEKIAANASQDLSKKINDAFKTTQVNALDTEVKKLTGNFKGVGDAAQNELKAIGTVTKGANGEILNTQANLRVLKRQLANLPEGGEADILAAQVGHIEEKLLLANEAGRAFSSGNKFKSVGILTEEIAKNILSFNFAGAQKQSELLAQVSSKITFKDATKGLGQLGSTLLNIGKSLLKNPLFLLGAAVFGVIESFEAFEKAAEAFKKVVEEDDAAIRKLTEGIELLSAENEKAAIDYDVLSNKRKKTDGEIEKNLIDHKQAMAEVNKKFGEEEKALNERIEKAREEDGFKGTKNLLDALGFETELRTEQKQKITQIRELQNQELLKIDEKFGIKAKTIVTESNKKRFEEFKKSNEEATKLLDDLTKKLRESEKKDTEFNIKFRVDEGSTEQIKAQFAVQRQLVDEANQEDLKRVEERRKAAQENGTLTLSLENKFREARKLIAQRSIQDIKNLGQEEAKAIIDNNTKLAEEELTTNKAQQDALLEIFQAGGNDVLHSESEIAVKRLQIEQDFLNAKIAIIKSEVDARAAAGLDTSKQTEALTKLYTELKLVTAKGEKDISDKQFAEQNSQIDRDEAHSQAVLRLHKASAARLLDDEIRNEKDRLRAIEQEFGKESDAYRAQQDKINALVLQASKARTETTVSGIKQIVDATLQAANQLIDIEIKRLDQMTSLQEKRVSDAKDIADKGNSQLLKLEKKRLDDLNKEKEKFVRAQQALAVIELIANTAVAISKAVAEGGGFASVAAVAAALIALIAGLASARAIASQAAFYEGGYTGGGNPREESKNLGKKHYTYHKEEFVFNHKKTKQYRDIFEGIHNGSIDLQDWQTKAKLFNSMNTDINTHTPSHIINNTVEISQLKEQMNDLINAVKSQGYGFTLNEEGFSGYMTKVAQRQDFIKNRLAK
jgi:hypothetical protein